MKITRSQLRRIIREAFDTKLSRARSRASLPDSRPDEKIAARRAERRHGDAEARRWREMDDQRWRVERELKFAQDPAWDSDADTNDPDDVDSQDMADAKRYAKPNTPEGMAKYLGISVEDWYRIRQEMDDHYEDRHMEDQMAFDYYPDEESGIQITESALKRIINESLLEKVDISKPGDPKELWDELQSIRGNQDIYLLDKLGPDKYTRLLALRDEYATDPTRYKEFFDLVAIPGGHRTQLAWDPETNKMTRTPPPRNDYMLFAGNAHSVFNRKMGVAPASEVQALKARRDDLDSQFEKADVSDMADAMYGRKRHQVIHKPTGTVVGGGVNRRGSLGT